MVICICHRVSDRDIARAAREGCASFEELQDELRVGTGCGACGDCAREVFGQHAGAAVPQGCARSPNRMTAAPAVGA
jgi:bacterioferritin-associated ferredoxin